MMKLTFRKDQPINILCLGAHCDDIEIGAGGTLLKIFEEYTVNSIKWVVITSDPVRKKEAIASANLFLKGTNNHEIIIGSFRDSYLPSQASEVKVFFENLKSLYTPDLIFTHYKDDKHQDHRVINELTWNTFRSNFILEYEICKYDGDIGSPNFYVPLTKEIVEKRNQIITGSFETQRSKHWFDDQSFKAIMRIRGIESANYYAEAFYARKVIL
jgi:LmbE family N-acetylglucosaminyl deacetylase